MDVQIARPASAVHSATGFLGLAGLIAALATMITLKADPRTSVFWVLAASGLPMLVFEIFLAWQRKTFFAHVGRNPSPGQPVNWLRVATKLIGFAVAWTALWGWFEWVPIYRRPEYFFALIHIDQVLPLLAIAGTLYLVWCDGRLADPHDGSWHTGRILASALDKVFAPSGPAIKTDWLLAGDFLLGWFIKGFFLVFLVSILPGNLETLSHFPDYNSDSLGRFVFWSTNLLFTIDIVIAAVGYACTFKPLNSHIRSVNPTLLGWLAALSCYPPFGIVGEGNLIDYMSGGTYWDLWLRDAPLELKWAWGVALVGCLVLYTWATVAFGIRFSNLTDRGILTHGPYRLLRHPAYVAKNTFWWLVHVPWINQLGTITAIKCCVMLAAVNMIYALRAWTEEQHLVKDPVYKQYLDWMKSRSLWQRLRD